MKYGTALVWDSGLFPYAATKLAEGFERVLYYTPYQDSFPVSRKTLWGSGLEGVERTNDFFEHLDEADLIMFPDVGMGDLQIYLREHGYRVWGSAGAEILELDRVGLKRLMLSKGMARPKTWIIQGMDDLREHLEDPDHDDQHVKISEFRGDTETHHHKNPWLSQDWLRRTEYQLGMPMRNKMTFVVEAGIDGVEVGYDGFCIDGAFPAVTAYGYEAKDVAYLGRVCKAKDLPVVLQEVNHELGPVLMELGCRSLFSTEVRVTKDGTGFLIDPSLRFPSPPSGALMETFSNWPEIFHEGAGGELVEPVPTAMYCAELVMRSEYARDGFLALRFPESHRHLVKLHGHAIIDGTDYVVSLGMDVIGGAVGVGDTMDEAIAQARDVAESIEAEGLEYEEASFDVLKERIEQGVTHGIAWNE